MKHCTTTYFNWLKRLNFYGIRNTSSLLLNLKKNKSFSLNYYGKRFYLRGNSVDFAVFNSIFAREEYNIEIGFNPKYIVDAGANIGASTLYFNHRYPEAEIIAVEPEKSNFELLLKNTEPFQNIKCVLGGLYAADTNLVIADKNAEKYAFRVEKNNSGSEGIPGFKIDTLMNNFGLPYIDILKMDIEGAEYSIFKNGTLEWLPRVKVIIAELHDFIFPGVGEVVTNVLSGSGFNLSMKGENIIAFNPDIVAGRTASVTEN